jgi:hypothetical protein
MPTAATTTEDSRSKLAQNHPHDFTMKEDKEPGGAGSNAHYGGGDVVM